MANERSIIYGDELPETVSEDEASTALEDAAKVIASLPPVRARETLASSTRLFSFLEKVKRVTAAGLVLACLVLPACVCSVEPPPPPELGFCARLEAYACANAQCDARGEPTADRCDLDQVEACVSAIEASPSCWEAGGIASSELCTTACASGAP